MILPTHPILNKRTPLSTNALKSEQSRLGMSNFDLNAILRGAQLTVVGGELYPGPRRVAELILRCSTPRSAESTSVYFRPLPTGCAGSCSRYCHPHTGCCSGTHQDILISA